MIYSDVPNVVSAFGYTNATGTLKCDLTQHGHARSAPDALNDPELTTAYSNRAQ